ncbi:MAG: hypothetical protein WEA10_04930 [Actinomycetota bacterium]
MSMSQEAWKHMFDDDYDAGERRRRIQRNDGIIARGEEMVAECAAFAAKWCDVSDPEAERRVKEFTDLAFTVQEAISAIVAGTHPVYR